MKGKRYLTEITFKTDHFLANLLAVRSFCGITPLSKAKELVNSGKNGVTINNLHLELNTKLSTDDLVAKLDEYEIYIKITNQQ